MKRFRDECKLEYINSENFSTHYRHNDDLKNNDSTW